MMRWIITSSIKSRILVVTLAVFLIIIGISQLGNTPISVYPEFSPVYVEVQTEALGLSAVEVEQLITVPLEADLLNGVAWLKEIRSESIPGLSSVIMIFEPGTDPMHARQVVQERLTQAHALPNVSNPPVMVQPLSSTSRVMKIGLTSDELSLIDMSVLARWTIKPYLMGIEGVANVSIWGQRKQQLQVQVDPKQLRDKGVTLNQIIKTTGEALWVSPLTFLTASTPGTGGFFDTPNQRLGIRHILPISTPEELASVTVHGEKILLGDVAIVEKNHQPLIGDAIINGKPGLLLVIEKFPWASTVDITTKLDNAVDVLRPGLTGIDIDSHIYRPASLIQMSIDNLSAAFTIGFVLLALFLFFAMYEWRAVLVSFAVMSVSLIVAALILYLNGTIFNMMVLAGLVIAIGVIIDDAIISSENAMNRLSQRSKDGIEESKISIIINSLSEMSGAMIFSTLIIILMTVPLYFTAGISKAFFRPMVISYILAVVVSMFVAVSLAPALSTLLFSKTPVKHRNSPFISKLQDVYYKTITGFIQKPSNAYVIFAIFVIAGFIVLPFLSLESQPPYPKERELSIKWEGRAGTSHLEMQRITIDAIEGLKSVPGVRNVIAHLGRAVLSDKVVNVNSGQIWVSLTDEADYDETVKNIQDLVDGYPGLIHEVETYLKESVRNIVPTADNPFAIRLYGENLDVLHTKADEIKQSLSNVNGINNLIVELPTMEPTIKITMNLETAKSYGIKPGDIRRASATLLSGIIVGSLFEEQKVFDVVVWGMPETRSSITSIRNLLVNTPQGEYVRLGDVADVNVISTPNVIKREGVSRYVDISFNTDGSDISSLEADIEKGVSQVDFPLEFHAKLIRQSSVINNSENSDLSFLIAALFGIFLLLQASFGSWRFTIVFFVSLIIPLSGGLLAVLISGSIISFGSIAGFLLISAIAIRNAIVLVKHYQQIYHSEHMTFDSKLIIRGVQDRFKPIIVTTLSTGLVFLTCLFFHGMPGFDLIYPMSVVIIGGLITSIILNLLIVPILFQRFGSIPEDILVEKEAY